MLWKSILILMCCWLFSAATTWGNVPDAGRASTHDFKGSLKFRKGEIQLPNGVAKLRLPENFRYLGPEDTERVLVNAWGNPAGNNTLGMLVPAGLSPAAKDGWGIVIAYREDGHVSDKDADRIDYDKLLNEMRKGLAKVNKERNKSGNERIDLIGWMVKPRYDRASHTLSWAKELSFGGSRDHTMNYNVSFLGRKGVLMLNAVAGMGQITEVAKNIRELHSVVKFNPGQRYEDFNVTTDRIASHGFFPRLVTMESLRKIILIVLLSALGAGLVHLLMRKNGADLPSS
jgi:uncharacterized membrane-anchored protein